MALNGMIMCS